MSAIGRIGGVGRMGLVAAAVRQRRMLDGIDAASVLSVRRLRSNWAGPCMRVRHVGTNAETDISFGSDDFVNTAALLAFAGGGSLAVSVWYDQSGAGRHGTQVSAAIQPQIVINGVMQTDAGRPCLITTPSGSSMSIGSSGLMRDVAGASISTVFKLSSEVVNTVNTSIAFVSSGVSGSATRLAFMLNPLGSDNLGVGTRRLDGDSYIATPGIVARQSTVGAITLSTIVMDYSTATQNQWINRAGNIQNATLHTPGFTSNTDPLAANIFGRSLVAVPTGTRGSEFIFFNHALSESERLRIEANQSIAYGAWTI